MDDRDYDEIAADKQWVSFPVHLIVLRPPRIPVSQLPVPLFVEF
jgi:hypothetical protein